MINLVCLKFCETWVKPGRIDSTCFDYDAKCPNDYFFFIKKLRTMDITRERLKVKVNYPQRKNLQNSGSKKKHKNRSTTVAEGLNMNYLLASYS